MIQTSNFGQVKAIVAAGLEPVAISRGIPSWYKGRREMRLCPTWPMLKMKDAEFDPLYDAMLHAIFLGFVFSMIFAHAPIIFPAILGKPLPFRRIFYVHVTVLHAALLLRVVGDFADSYEMWKWGAIGTVTALLIFIVVTIGVISDPEAAGSTAVAPSHG